MANHGETERHLIKLFTEAKQFTYKENKYEILKIGKPRPSRGECKTDIYILCKDNLGGNTEFKISIKQADADFLENKMSYERAVEIFGDDAEKILIESILKIKESFENEPLINFSKFKRTETNCIKIGWKFELINKAGGDKSSELILNDDQKTDVYSGTNLNVSKKNCKVNGELIENSGVANFILEVDRIEDDLNYYITRLEDITSYAIERKIYFACKALNYRVNANKWDGDRPLSVFCDWSINSENKLEGKLIFDKPLQFKGNAIGNNIRVLLDKLGINSDNFTSIKSKLSSTVKLHE